MKYILLFLLTAISAFPCAAEVLIKEVVQDGEPVIVIENPYYRTVLAPTIGRMPLSYYDKLTGKELFRHPVKPIKKNFQTFQTYGGIIDAIPAVDGEKSDDKGWLWRVPWTNNIEKSENRASYTGTANIKYNDPVTEKPYKLSFKKIITGYSDSACLKMDYEIKNIGPKPAEFMLSVHARMSIGKDIESNGYFWAPGRKCRYFYSSNIQQCNEYAEGKWLPWPFAYVTEIRNLSPGEKSVFVFIPADWCAVGEEQTKTAAFFISSPVKIGGKEHKMKMGVQASRWGYVVEPSLTYCMSYSQWQGKNATVKLNAGETCSFTLYFTPFHDVERSEIKKVRQVNANVLVLSPFAVKKSGRKYWLNGKISVSGAGILIIKKQNGIICERIQFKSGTHEIKQELLEWTSKDECLIQWQTRKGYVTLSGGGSYGLSKQN